MKKKHIIDYDFDYDLFEGCGYNKEDATTVIRNVYSRLETLDGDVIQQTSSIVDYIIRNFKEKSIQEGGEKC